MKIVFFEVQDWEKELLQKHFPEATLCEEHLTSDNASQYADTEIISCFIYSRLDKPVFNAMPQLKFITTRSTGYEHIDLQEAKIRNVQVANVPEYGSKTVAEYTFALILTLTKKMYQSINQAKNFNFDHKLNRGIDLNGKILGIIGFGKIGIEVLKIAKGFGMDVVVYTHTHDEVLAQKWGFKYVDLPELLQISDIKTLHLPYTKDTHHFINMDNIELFKKGSYLINTARGGLIDTQALVFGLEKGILSGVGLDVLEEETALTEEVAVMTSKYKQTVDLKTLVLDHVLINHPQVVITPHNAFNSIEALERIVETSIANIEAFIHHGLANSVS